MRACFVLAAVLSASVAASQEAVTDRSKVIEIVAPDAIDFQSNATHYVHREATKGATALTIRDLHDAKIHFLGEISGSVTTKSKWQDDRGVVNIVDCRGLEITGLKITNSKKYVPGSKIGGEEATALCISRSKNIQISHSAFKGEGKSIVLIHSGSDVSLKDSDIAGYYFELQVGASSVVTENVTFHQHNPVVGDSHAAIWVSSSMRNDTTRESFEDTAVLLKGATFNLKSGRGIVSGNGSYDTRSTLAFEDTPTINHAYPAVGFAIFHRNYHSITVILKQPYPELVDLVRAKGGKGVGRFVIYHETPGRPSEQSPIVVDGVESKNIGI